MIPLMTATQHEALRSLRGEIMRSMPTAAHVFVPVCGDLTKATPFRLLFVGRATRGYQEPDLATFIGARDRAEEIVRTHLTQRKSPFWQFINGVLRGVLQERGLSVADADIPDFMGWSNLVKIGDANANAPLASLKAQAALCIEQLQREIKQMRPNAVILLTRDYGADEILYPVFGREDWRQDVVMEDRVAFVNGGLNPGHRGGVKPGQCG